MIHNQLDDFTREQMALGRGTGLGEHQDGVQRLGETLTPVVNLHERSDLWLLAGSPLFIGENDTAAGGAGTKVKNQLFNATTQYLGLVRGAWISSTTSQRIYLCAFNTQFAAGDSGGVCVDRRTTQQSSQLRMRSLVDNTAPGAFAGAWDVLANSPLWIPIDGVLGSNDGFHFITNTAVTALTTVWYWRERVAKGGELNAVG